MVQYIMVIGMVGMAVFSIYFAPQRQPQSVNKWHLINCHKYIIKMKKLWKKLIGDGFEESMKKIKLKNICLQHRDNMYLIANERCE